MVQLEVEVAGGRVRGLARDDLAVFLGIPYAAPPFGSNRMRPPRPVEGWQGVRDATRYGPTVPKGDYPTQYQSLFPEVRIPGDECLNVNVWTPDPEASGLPVFVWIHGGGFMNGSGSVPEYDGAEFARAGIVCVTLNYRLGPEGFLYLGDGPANLGTLDQIAALGWVRDNIAAFGGDPSRVTVAGESGGAISVDVLLVSELAQGLFARAVSQSGGVSRLLTPRLAAISGRNLAHALGVEADRQAMARVDIPTLTRTASDLVAEMMEGRSPYDWGDVATGYPAFGPMTDGTVIPRDPLGSVEQGAGCQVPLLVGSNRDEGRLFFVANDSLEEVSSGDLQSRAEGFGLNSSAIAAYRQGRPGASPGDLLAAIVGDWFFWIPSVRIAEARSRGGGQTWMYRFDHPEPDVNKGLGACHGAEMPYVFGTHMLSVVRPRIGAPSDRVAETTQQVWHAFVRGEDPPWSPYNEQSRATGLLAESLVEASDPAAREREAWTGVW